MTSRTEIHADGTFNDQTREGGRAVVTVRTATGPQAAGSSYEMELRALVEAVKMAECPCTVISDHEGIVGIARRGITPRYYHAVWQELYAAVPGKDVGFGWRRRDQPLGSRPAHQLARDAAKGR
jgi:ribonuclease HI